MTLSDLLDLEARLQLDADTDPAELARRDRAAWARIPEERRDDPRELVPAWLAELRARGEGRTFGQRVTRALALTTFALGLAGAGMGWGAASAALGFDGSQPVNIAPYLALFALLPIALLAVTLLVMPLRLRAPELYDRLPFAGLFASLLRSALDGARRLGRRVAPEAAEATAARLAADGAMLSRLRARRSLYGRAEVHVLFGLAQLFALCFYASALLCTLRLIVFSDLAFGWGTTLQLDPSVLHGLLAALSAPWGWLAPEAVPSEALVAATRYVRLEGTYVGAGDAVSAGGWWPFLVAALATYGVLPRAVLLGWSRWSLRRSVARVPLDTPDVERALRRLRTPVVSARGTGETDARPAWESEAPVGGAAGIDGAGAAARECLVVRWRDVPVAAPLIASRLAATLGWRVASEHDAGGSDYTDTQLFLDTLARDTAEGAPPRPVVLLAEAWEAPDKATRRFLAAVREAAGPTTPVVVALGRGTQDGWVSAAPDEVRTWRNTLAANRDPYLGVEDVGVSP